MVSPINSYDYRSYFQQIISDLDAIQTNQDDLLTEIRLLHTDSNDRLDQIDNTLHDGIILFSGLLVLACVIGVFFK